MSAPSTSVDLTNAAALQELAQRRLQETTAGAYPIRGHVVGKASKEGGLVGFNPHMPGTVHVVDVDDPSLHIEVDLRKLNSGDIVTATHNGDLIKNASTNEDAREAAVTSFRNMAGIAKEYDRGVAEAAARPPFAGADLGGPYPTPTVVQSRQVFATATHSMPSPASAFRAHMDKATAAPVAAPPMQVAPPENHVIFELDAFGSLDAYYHLAYRYDMWLVLAFDRRYRGPKYFPPATKDGQTLFVDIEELPEVYAVQSLGCVIPFMDWDICLLIVDQARAKN